MDTKKFLIWRIHYHVPKLHTPPKGLRAQQKLIKDRSGFVATPAKTWNGQPWIISGDEEVAIEGRRRLAKLLFERGKAPHQVDNFKFDWEPFEVVRDMLREVESDRFKYRSASIGGAPQVLKIYEHLNARYLAIEWGRDDKGLPRTFVCGRQALGYETPTLWTLNPDTLVSRHPFYTVESQSEDHLDHPNHL